MSQRNRSDCNLILESERRRRNENIIQVLGIEFKKWEITAVEQRKANARRQAKYLMLQHRSDYCVCK